jgi:hypothetical protein
MMKFFARLVKKLITSACTTTGTDVTASGYTTTPTTIYNNTIDNDASPYNASFCFIPGTGNNNSFVIKLNRTGTDIKS